MSTLSSIYHALAEIEKNNGSAALCTVVTSQGSKPRHVGSKMLVYPDGKFLGTVSRDSNHNQTNKERSYDGINRKRFIQAINRYLKAAQDNNNMRGTTDSLFFFS